MRIKFDYKMFFDVNIIFFFLNVIIDNKVLCFWRLKKYFNLFFIVVFVLVNIVVFLYLVMYLWCLFGFVDVVKKYECLFC